MRMLPAIWKRNDRKARWLIFSFSAIVFAAVMLLSRVKLDYDPGFDVHIFAQFNAIINSIVAFLLIIGLLLVKLGKFRLHRNVMLGAMLLSVLFLMSYICHHLLAGDTRFGDADHDGIVTEAEKQLVGSTRIIYYVVLGTHIPLAGLVLPFILFSAYRGFTGEFDKHKRLVRYTWPVWFYVAVTGVIVYLMIRPYY